MKFTDEECATGMECGKEGVYLCEVKAIAEKTTKAGDEMWNLEFKDVKTGDVICYDNLVFSVKGRGIAFTKLKALGVKKDADSGYDIEPDELIGFRAKLNLVKETYNGNDRLTPDIYASEPFQCGYEAVAKSPDGNDDIPF